LILVLLIAAKLLINGYYLHLSPFFHPFENIVLAEEDKQTDVPDLSEENRKMAEMLREKEQELKDREAQLDQREQELLPLKKEIDQKLEELTEIQTQLTLFAKQLAEREEALNSAKIGHLVSLYSAMAPVKAAQIMDKLKLDTVVLIMSKMRGKIAGQILAAMETEKGALISEKLSKPN
jgi:flagellar motility protein MotE (MotC chaperone)